MKDKANEIVSVNKYIVEANSPQAGQCASSGGIRANGKIVSQYRNPIPYSEPIAQSSTNTVPKEVSTVKRYVAEMVQ